jgi:TatD DNase family protein
MALYDIHAHLTDERLRSDLGAVLDRAAQARVTTIVANGLNPADNQAVRELARAHPAIKPAYGLYPVDAVLQAMRAAGEEYEWQRETWSADVAVRWVAEHLEEAFAVGEIGLDGYWVKEAFWADQEEVFRRLVRMAMDADKPIIIHTRSREQRALELLEELGAPRVCWHCFGGKVKLARHIAEQGHYISIPANARRSEAFTKMLQKLPRQQLLFETDCPYLAPHRDETNEPANVAVTARYAAELWGVSEAVAEGQMAENFERLFGVAP